MRVTAKVKQATRGRILEAARELFTTQGFAESTTRDLAKAAGVANGTLFNYFPSKEAIAMELVDEALGRGHNSFEAGRCDAATLDEDLFSYVAAGLRELKPYRGFIRPVLEASLGPLARPPPGEDDSAQARHLEAAHALALKHGHGELPPLSLQLYWTLYTGVLTFWSDDTSPHQEDTLALLDQSLQMFVGWLGPRGAGPGGTDAKTDGEDARQQD